jgi:hypothetical protein
LKIFGSFEFESKSLECIFENDYASLPIQLFNLAQKPWQPNLISLWEFPRQPKPLRPLWPKSAHPGVFSHLRTPEPPLPLRSTLSCAALPHPDGAEPKWRPTPFISPSSNGHPLASSSVTGTLMKHHRLPLDHPSPLPSAASPAL